MVFEIFSPHYNNRQAAPVRTAYVSQHKQWSIAVSHPHTSIMARETGAFSIEINWSYRTRSRGLLGVELRRPFLGKGCGIAC